MKNRRKKQNIQKSYACKIFGLIVAITVIAVSGGVLLKRKITESPENTLVEYMNHIEKKEYEVMYTCLLYTSWIKDCDFAAGEFDEPLALKVSKHSSDNFPVGTKMISNRLMSDFQLVCSFDRGLF